VSPWARIDDGFHSHPKVRDTSLAAVGLFALGLSYCANHLTDGALPESFVRDHARGHAGRKALHELIERRWFERAEGGGLHIAGYLEWNPSRAQVDTARDRERRKKADQRAQGRQAVLPWNGDSKAEKGSVSPGDSDPPRPSSPSSPSKAPSVPRDAGEESGDLLDRIKAELAERLPEYVHYQWIAPLSLVSYADDRLSLDAPHHLRGWIRERYLPLLVEVATELEGRPVDVVVAESDEERSERIRREAGEQRKDRRAERALQRSEPNEAA
jgi:hypothetical protein